jgi:hypothetical protein
MIVMKLKESEILPFFEPKGRKHIIKQSTIFDIHLLNPDFFIPFINILPP